MFKWLFSRFYDRVMEDAEQRCLQEWRRSLLLNLSGDVLEVGAGTGANIEVYPSSLRSLHLTEPSLFMREKLSKKASKGQLQSFYILGDSAEELSFPDKCFDAVVCTFVLCSVKSLENALREIHRVLRPQGRLLFIEHVAAHPDSKHFILQRRINFLWKRLCAGCHLQRPTEEAISKVGFEIVELKNESIRGVLPPVRPSIRGIAIKS